jgi:hypothetical protein
MKSNVILLVGLFLASPATAADSNVLREIMGETVYRQSGIQELSEEQVKVLEQWILDNADRRQSVERPPATTEPTPGDAESDGQIALETAAVTSAPAERSPEERGQDEDEEPDVIRSRIDGPFKGWRNNGTRFRLENGEIWEQRQPSTFITDLESPEVIIRRNRFGHTLEVPAISRKVHVKRIR